ncbi:MAG: DNA polymerase III subunit gamma/tau, partial [Thermoleophilia bacterium]
GQSEGSRFMAHVSLYRKYRPATFAEVVGQEHVTRTLANAITTGQVSHAYLFAGSRGTGKTSTAKLLAKALNCVDGPTDHPCGKCDSCVAIGAGSSLDVIEMDAASNRGIDDIREIRDRVAFASVEGQYRVYILDEAHMLTKEASNAFLKVLEEPPAHVIFVLCTTEAHKVIPTIQSRCQKFEFRRPDANMVLEVLQRIVTAEGIEIDEISLATIARSASGAFRDAIGALDQLATYGGSKINLADVLSMLGTVELELLFEVVDIVAENDSRGALLFVDRLAGRGRDFAQFDQELIGHLRDIFLVQQLDDDTTGIINAAEEDRQRLKVQARLLTPARVLRFVELLSEAYTAMRQGGDPRLQLELAFIRITQPEVDSSTRSLIYRIEQLEERLQAGGSPAPRPAPRPNRSQTRQVTGDQVAPRTAPATAPAPGNDEATAVTDTDASMREPLQVTLDEVPDDSPVGIELSLDKITRAWSIILNQVKKRKISLVSLLQQGRPTELDGKVLTISFPAGSEFHKSQVEKPGNLAVLAEVLKEMTGASLRIKCELVAESALPAPPRPDREDVLTTDDVIAMIKDEFSAEEIQ